MSRHVTSQVGTGGRVLASLPREATASVTLLQRHRTRRRDRGREIERAKSESEGRGAGAADGVSPATFQSGRARSPFPTFCSVRPSAGWKMPAHVGVRSALLSPPIHTLISPRNTLTDTPN